MEDLIKLFKQLNIEPIVVRIPSQPMDLDIDKIHVTKLGKELLTYYKIKSIANSNVNDIDWTIAIKYLSEAVCVIHNKIKNNQLKHPEQLKEFIENCCAIYEQWDNIYKQAFLSIKEYGDNIKIEKSIDKMNAEELREYIKTHKL